MHRDLIDGLVAICKAAQRGGDTPDEIRNGVLAREVERIMKSVSARDFLDWVKEDREYSYYYYDAQQSGVCAKPPEAVARIFESIALDALD